MIWNQRAESWLLACRQLACHKLKYDTPCPPALPPHLQRSRGGLLLCQLRLQRLLSGLGLLCQLAGALCCAISRDDLAAWDGRR